VKIDLPGIHRVTCTLAKASASHTFTHGAAVLDSSANPALSNSCIHMTRHIRIDARQTPRSFDQSSSHSKTRVPLQDYASEPVLIT
jgi:hypothetical protein